ncbi:MAG: DNA pilot protein [Microvirus sp.]|nr:MAG: DNA pilot protein [Microvirus sp.]
MGLFDSISQAIGIGAPEVSAGLSLFNGIMGRNSQQTINSANQANFQAQRDWQTEMANTAHQREVADLTAAHLNPILSAHGSGSSTPAGGALPVLSSPYQAGVNAAQGVSSAAANWSNSAKSQAEIPKTEAETANVRESTNKLGYEIAQILEDTGLKADQRRQVNAEIVRIGADVGLKDAETVRVASEVAKLIAERDNLTAETAYTHVKAALARLSEPEAKAFADMFRSKVGHEIPWEREVRGVVSSAFNAYAAGRLGGALSPTVSTGGRGYKLESKVRDYLNDKNPHIGGR